VTLVFTVRERPFVSHRTGSHVVLVAIWTVVPEYMNEVLMFSIEENGVFSALPHVASFIVVMATGSLADVIIGKGYLKRVNARKLFHGIGTISPAICMLIISFLDCQKRYLAVGLLVVGVALKFVDSHWNELS
jgi:MFS transporter, ACS family, solute carrier family 17 (sodium-dependent inorganic phosphate cotransporter), member 5